MRRVGENRGAGTNILVGTSWEQVQCNALCTALPKVYFVGSNSFYWQSVLPTEQELIPEY